MTCDNIYPTSGMSQTAIQNLRAPLVGNLDTDLCKMATQSLPTDKELSITPNTKETSESHDSAFFCVDWIERRNLNIRVRLNKSERKALESAARERRMTLSDYVRESMLNPKNIAA